MADRRLNGRFLARVDGLEGVLIARAVSGVRPKGVPRIGKGWEIFSF